VVDHLLLKVISTLSKATPQALFLLVFGEDVPSEQ